jgi:hypothetical protein
LAENIVFAFFLRFQTIVTKVELLRKKLKVTGAVILDGKHLPEKEIKFVHNLLQFTETLIPRRLWSSTSADGYSLSERTAHSLLKSYLKIYVLEDYSMWKVP